MKIVHTVEFYPGKGGIATYLDQLVPELSALGHNVFVVSRSGSVQAHGDLTANVALVSKEEEAIQYIQKIQPDIVHVHEWLSGEILENCQQSTDPRIIIHHHAYGFICPGRDLFWRQQREICQQSFGPRCILNAYLKCCQTGRRPTEVFRGFQRVYRNLRYRLRANCFVANSTYVRRKLVKAGLPEDRVIALNYFTDLQYKPEMQPVPGRILFLGRIAESKGLDLLIDALCHVDESVDWTLVIAGEGYDMHSIKRMIGNRSFTNRVHFAGWVAGEEKVRLFHEASVVVVPSRWPEAFGIVGIEAMACARPVVAFDVGGVSDWLQHEVTGYLVPAYDTSTTSRRIMFLLQNPDIAKNMGEAGRQVVKQRFLVDHHITKLLKIYQSAIKTTIARDM